MMNEPQPEAVSFDVTYDKQYALMLRKTGLEAFQFDQASVTSTNQNLTFERPLSQGRTGNTLQCSYTHKHFAYTNNLNITGAVHVGSFTDTYGFQLHNKLTFDHARTVTSIDWSHHEPLLLSGSQDNFASLWNIEAEVDVIRMAVNGQWCLIESDPGVFSELIKEFGCQGLQVEELWSMDEDAFNQLKPVYGLIFLFKWKGDADESGKVLLGDTDMFFAKQVINNACATQAILSVLLNIQDSSIELGDTLTQFKEFCSSFSPALKGLSLTNADKLREVHNSFARQNMFEFDSKAVEKDDDVYHFVAFVPFKGRVYELDGLREGPVDHGPAGEDWLSIVRPMLQTRIAKHSASEITFNLMAVVGDRRMLLQNQIAALSADKHGELMVLRDKLQSEEAKLANYKVENIRRKHNYLPLIMEMLKILSEKEMLLPLTVKAKAKLKEREDKEKSEKSEKMEQFRGLTSESEINKVKTNRHDRNIFATCHGRDITIWDRRAPPPSKAALFSAHSNKTTCLDWSPDDETFFLTASLDRHVRLWSMKNLSVSKDEYKLSQPVWRALYDPLHSQYAAVITHPGPHADINPHIWEISPKCEVSQYNILESSDGPVIEARVRSDDDESQLVGLTREGKLQIWKFQNPRQRTMQMSCSPSPDPIIASFPNQMPSLSSSPNSRFVLPEIYRSVTSAAEKYNYVRVEAENVLVVSPRPSSIKIRIVPPLSTELPTFRVEENPYISQDRTDNICKNLMDRAKECEAAQENWVDPCIQLAKQEIEWCDDEGLLRKNRGSPDMNGNVPFPRVSGARFGSNDVLIVFKRPKSANYTDTEPASTPRAMSQMNVWGLPKRNRRGLTQTPSSPQVSGCGGMSVHDYYYPSKASSRQDKNKNRANITLFDISKFLPISQQLAKDYCLDPSRGVSDLCAHNMRAALTQSRQDLVQLWQLLQLTTNLQLFTTIEYKKPWSDHPYGRKLIETLIKFYYLKKDIQTLAMIFSVCSMVDFKVKNNTDYRLSLVPQHVSLPQNSFSSSISIATNGGDDFEDTLSPLVDNGLNGDFIKIAYSNILYNWGLLEKRAEVMKTVRRGAPKEDYFSVSSTELSTPDQWECSICRMPVRSLGAFCLECLHGGHVQHIQSWFNSATTARTQCPTGCGCNCLEYMGNWPVDQ